MKQWCKQLLALVGVSAFSVGAYSATCQSVFPDPASSHSTSGYIQFQPQAKLIGSDGLLNVATMLDNSGGVSCDTAACLITGSPSGGISLPSYQYSFSATDVRVNDYSSGTLQAGQYRTVTVGNGGSLATNVSAQPFIIKTLNVNFNATLTLSSGVYWIEQLTLGQNAKIVLASNASVVIYTRAMSTNINNAINVNGQPSQLLILSEGYVSIGQYSQVKGFIYSASSVTYNTDITHVGATNAQQIILHDRTRVTYDQTALTSLNVDGLCTQPATVPAPIAHWSLNTCALTGASGEVVDSIAGNNGRSVNSPSIDSNGQYCQAAYFRGDKDYLNLPHSSAYTVAQGSVSFWMNTNNLAYFNVPQEGGMALLSKDESGLGNGGHFSMWVTNTGAIKVNQQSASTTYQLNTSPVIVEGQWHHVVYTFGSLGMQVYVDNVLVGTNANYTSGWQSNTKPLLVAANANRHNPQDSAYNDLGDFYQGRIDDIRLFRQQLSAEQIALLNAQAEETCITCGSNATLISHWKMDVCSLTGAANEIVDVVRGYNGRAVNGASAIPNGRFCQASGFDGSAQHANIAHGSAMQLSSGTLTMWFKVADLDHNRDQYGNSLQGIFSKDSSGLDYGGQFTLYVDQDGKLIFHQETQSQSFDIYTGSVIEEREQWYHLAYSWGPGGMKVHLNGVYLGGYFQSGFSWQQNQEPIILGASATNSGNYQSQPWELHHFLRGEIDDVRLYSGELTTADVQALFTASDYACTTCNGAGPRLHYKFEEITWPAISTVLDSSANLNNGTPMGNVQPVSPSNDISCRALDVPENYNTYQAAVNTNLDLNQVGDRGTVSFWYRSDQPWIGGGNRQLFDASSQFYFYMSLTNNGELGFGMEDASGNNMDVRTQQLGYAANEWVHIALTWNMPGEDIDLYVNGSRVFMYGNWNLTNPALGNLTTMKVGDNSSSNFVGYMTANSANGQFDDFRLYDYEQSREQMRADMADVEQCYAVHHYEITHPSQSLTCSAASVTIKACANASCSELVSEAVSVNLPSGNWSASNPVTFTGTTTLTLAETTEAPYTLSVTAANQASSPLNATQCTNNCVINFVNAGFEFYDTANPYQTALPDLIAESDLGRIGLRAVQNNAGVCKALLNGQQSVTLGYDCVSDNTASYSPDQCSVPFAGIPVSGNGLGENSAAVTLTFNNNGEASLAGRSYADAGRLALSATATISGTTISSGTSQFDSVPAQLQATVDAATVNRAGAGHNLSIKALGANGSTLPGYAPGSLQLAVIRLLPVSASASEGQYYVSANQSVASSDATTWNTVALPSFVNGVYTYNDAYISEVGTYQFDLQDAGYLGQTIAADSVNLGRYTPAYFDVSAANTPQIEPACSVAFTYLGQSFGFAAGAEPSVQVTAYNARGQVTANYTDSQWALSPSTAALSNLYVTDNTGYTGSLSVISAGTEPVITENVDYDGNGVMTIYDTRLSYSKIATPTAASGYGSAFNSDLDIVLGASVLTDADGVCYQTSYPNGCESFTLASVQGSEMRYGRLRLDNSYGPESASLRMPVVAEYYNNGNWILNTQDSCTAVAFTQSSGQLTLENTSTGADEQDITGLLSGIAGSGTLTNGESGNGVIAVGPPLSNGVGVRGAVRIRLDPSAPGANWANHLNIDWDGDGDIDADDSPAADLFFGIYRGNDRTIHMREGF
ncbi:LamG domain-containing protein [Aestuariibacter sp. GS-14]|uniref:LamG domain-containing protein n=1 Tax=Aestuariibacter sp. GS-14 TaxID=2590670 RepID=UPI00112D31CB|nr:LamG domain-containing protein [Aestuariibacter sp. GS-14]TPV57319.1 LamG domain-containing protein [Aestuariibacter sp. GS-14]